MSSASQEYLRGDLLVEQVGLDAAERQLQAHLKTLDGRDKEERGRTLVALSRVRQLQAGDQS